MCITKVTAHALEQELTERERALATGIHAAFSLPDYSPGLEPAAVYLEHDTTPNVFRGRLAAGLPRDGRWLALASHEARPRDRVDIELLERYAVN
jgi:hypothetical protein